MPILLTEPAVLRSLLEGEGIVDVRPLGAGAPAGTRFWLRAGGPPLTLKPAYRILAERFPAGDDQDGQAVAGWAELAGSGQIRLDEAAIDALNGKTVVDLSALAGTDVVVLALRTHLLAEPAAVDSLPAEPAGVPSVPALSDGAFEAKLKGLAASVPWVELSP